MSPYSWLCFHQSYPIPVLMLSAASSIQTSYHLSCLSDHWNGAILEFGGDDPWKISYSKPNFSAKLLAVAFFKVGLWIGQILLFWIPGLWSYYVPGSLISKSWTLSSHGVLDLAWMAIQSKSSEQSYWF